MRKLLLPATYLSLVKNSFAGQPDYSNQAQQTAFWDCPECPEVPKWTSGELDNLLQWGRDILPFFDWWVIISAVLGGAMLAIAFPPTRQVIRTVVEVIKVVWNKTSRKK